MSATQILVVEDERLVAAALQNELEQFGYSVSGVAGSGNEAVQKAVEYRPDVVLMDIHLQGEVDGIEAGRQIHDRCGIPVVYLSAFSDPETVARASETEAFGYLLKPYEERELHTTIQMAIAKHRAEQKLEEAERWLAAILNGIDDAALAIDADGRVRFVNPAGEALSGWKKADAIDLPVSTVCSLVDANGQVPLDEMAARVVHGGHREELPEATWIVSRDDRETPVEGALSAIRDPRGELLGTVLTLRDISVRLELERLRRQTEERARRSQKMEAASRLAGGLAQHLNQLLHTILGNTSLALTATPSDAESHPMLQHIEMAAQRAGELVQRLLMFSTLSARPSSPLEQVDLAQLIPVLLRGIEPHLQEHVNLSYKPAEDLWPVAADELLLGQALLELALNAQDAMPRGGRLTVEVENVTLSEADLPAHPEGRNGQFVRVRVGDTGGGMKPTVRARMFEPYFTTKESGQAAGLGLALVYAAVEQQHGWIECSSQANHGTQLDLYLPRFGDHTSTEQPPPHAAKQSAAQTTILLADADPVVRDIGRRILECYGYRVLLAEDGLQAISIYQQAKERVDLAILDLNIPRLTAYAVVKRLLEFDPGVRVLLSGGYIAEDLTEGNGHMRGVITKPYKHGELLEMVRRALGKRAEK